MGVVDDRKGWWDKEVVDLRGECGETNERYGGELSKGNRKC